MNSSIIRNSWSGFSESKTFSKPYSTNITANRILEIDISNCVDIRKLSINIISPEIAQISSLSPHNGMINNIDFDNKKITLYLPYYLTANAFNGNGQCTGNQILVPMYYEIIEFM